MSYIQAALTRWKGACGLKQVQKGFCFDKEHDQLFALGWPHLRLLSDDPVDAYRLGMACLRESDFTLDVVMPRALATGLLRAWTQGELFITSPSARHIRDEVQSALWNSEPFTRHEIGELFQARMTDRSPLWSDSRVSESMTLLAEALTDTDWVVEAIVDTLEGLDSDELWEPMPTQSLITFQLGYLLLRLPQASANNIKIRLRDILDGPWGLGKENAPSTTGISSHLRAISLVLGGALAAENETDHDLRWYTHVADSPKTIKMRGRINRSFTMPDARLVFLAGTDLLDTRFGRWWANLTPIDQVWFLTQLAPIKAPQVVPLMARLALENGSVTKRAQAWTLAHRAYAEPILNEHAEKSSAGCRAMLDFLESEG